MIYAQSSAGHSILTSTSHDNGVFKITLRTIPSSQPISLPANFAPLPLSIHTHSTTLHITTTPPTLHTPTHPNPTQLPPPFQIFLKFFRKMVRFLEKFFCSKNEKKSKKFCGLKKKHYLCIAILLQ